MKKFALIVAGGKGARMNHTIPKQFISVLGKPVLMYSIESFYRFSPNIQVIVVLPEEYISFWKDLCLKFKFTIQHDLVSGGETRFHSVKNGLDFISAVEGIVAIHDGARPNLKPELIKKLFFETEKYGNAIPSLPFKESVRIISNQSNKSIDRNFLKIIQTPQCFLLSLIKNAYLQNYQNNFTDDATVAESIGIKIHLTEGDIHNLKITSSDDLIYIESILK